MDDVAGREVEAGRDDRLANSDRADGATGSFEFGTGSCMDRPADAAAGPEGGIGRVDDGIVLSLDDIAEDCRHGHGGISWWSIHIGAIRGDIAQAMIWRLWPRWAGFARLPAQIMQNRDRPLEQGHSNAACPKS